jgi:hypothetical protein
LKNRRLIGFFFAIALGLAAGLFYGWVVNPGVVKNTTISSLRTDFQTDYVLMIAEAYPEAADNAAAVELLQQTGEKDPLKAVQNAIVTAQQLGYSEQDIQSLRGLQTRLMAWEGAQ